jgi:hypothetical protein
MAGSCSEAAAAPRRMDNDEFSAIKAAGYTGKVTEWPGRAQRLICWKKRRQRYGENLP